MKKIIIPILPLMILLVTNTYSQTAKEKAETIAAEFSKQKNKEKEKNGVTIEKHRIVEAKTDVRDNTASYAGKYELYGFGRSIVLRQLADNTLEADLTILQDNKEVKKAKLKDIKIESALLTATLQYEDGKTVPFEGVFISRFENGEKTSGLGIRQVLDLSNGFIVDKAFYKRVE